MREFVILCEGEEFPKERVRALEEAMQGLEEKFHTLRGGKGIAFTVPLTGVIGVAIYRFLSNNRR